MNEMPVKNLQTMTENGCYGDGYVIFYQFGPSFLLYMKVRVEVNGRITVE